MIFINSKLLKSKLLKSKLLKSKLLKSKLLKKRVEPRKGKKGKKEKVPIGRKKREFEDPYNWCSTPGGDNKEITFIIKDGKILKTMSNGEEL